MANIPWPRLESFVMQLLEIDTIRDIRLATKALATLPQHWLQEKVVDWVDPAPHTAAARGVNLALHTHINHAQALGDATGRGGDTQPCSTRGCGTCETRGCCCAG